MIINKNVSGIQKVCVLQVLSFSVKPIEIIFVSLWHGSIVSSHIITESLIILTKYFLFSQVTGFQI